MLRVRILSTLALFAPACSAVDADAPSALERQARALAFLPTGEALVVSPDEGLISRVDVDGETYRSLKVGVLPERVLVIDARAYVSLHGDRVLKVLSVEAGALLEESSIEVCASPTALVTNEARDRLYVACTVGEEVVEISLPEHEVLRRFHVPGQPNWITLSPSEDVLYVAPRLIGALGWIRLDTGSVHQQPFQETNPVTPRSLFEASFRVTADLVVDATERKLIVGGQHRIAHYYGAEGPATTPELAVIPLAEDDAPLLEETMHVPLLGTGRLLTVMPANGSDTSELWVLFDDQRLSFEILAEEMVAHQPDATRLVARSIATIQTEIGSRDVAWHAGRGLVWSEVRRSVATLSQLDLEPRLEPQSAALAEFRQCVSDGWKDCESPSSMLVLDQRRTGFEIAPPVLSDEAEHGRELFESPTVASTSCVSCHPRGLGDGYNWLRPDNRQTRILPGLSMSSTSLRWDGSVASLEDELRLALAVGTNSLDLASPAALSSLGAYIETLPSPISRRVEGRDACVTRGRAVFSSSETGCAGCHVADDLSGDRVLERASRTPFGVETTAMIRTPALRGVGASPPYLHDGSANTLMELMTGAKSGELGDTSSLSPSELEDLVCFLESL